MRFLLFQDSKIKFSFPILPGMISTTTTALLWWTRDESSVIRGSTIFIIFHNNNNNNTFQSQWHKETQTKVDSAARQPLQQQQRQQHGQRRKCAQPTLPQSQQQPRQWSGPLLAPPSVRKPLVLVVVNLVKWLKFVKFLCVPIWTLKLTLRTEEIKSIS